MAGSNTRIPNFIKARKPEGLRELMFGVQARLGFEFNWAPIWVESEKMWYAWYPEELDTAFAQVEKLRGS